MKSSSTNITVEVHCQRPTWAIHHWEEQYRDSRYRIYINNDLITERSWIWDNTIYLKEHLWANLVPLSGHSIRLEPVVSIPEQAIFSLIMFNVDAPIKILSTKLTEITFKLV